jgi:putative tryptophan/tyrosine transport system substrate-binding protein
LEILIFHASTSNEIDAAFAALARERADGLFVAGDAFFNSRRVQFITLAARDLMPASYASREWVEAGGLMNYGTNLSDTFRQVDIYTGSILKGSKPADLNRRRASRRAYLGPSKYRVGVVPNARRKIAMNALGPS